MAQTGKRREKRQRGMGVQLLKGLGAAVLVTLAGVAVFALLMQWIRPSDGAVRVFNQVLKLLAVGAGVWTAVGRGSEGGLVTGAVIGLAYMAVGVAAYALLSGQHAPLSSYLADLGMGIASGGIVGMILSNFFAK